MQAIQSGISAAGAIPNGGSYRGFGFPNETFNENLNLPFGVTPAPNAVGNLSVPGVPFENVARSNNYIGLPSFETVPTAYLMLINKNDLTSREDTRHLSVGQIGFARTADESILAKHGGKNVPTYGVTPGQNSAEFKSLTALNGFLRGSGRMLYTSSKQITREWHLVGVFKNEVAPSNSWSLGQNQYANRIGAYPIPLSSRFRLANSFLQGTSSCPTVSPSSTTGLTPTASCLVRTVPGNCAKLAHSFFARAWPPFRTILTRLSEQARRCSSLFARTLASNFTSSCRMHPRTMPTLPLKRCRQILTATITVRRLTRAHVM